MGALFNIVGRIISTLLGLVLVLGGTVWILQSFNIAFNQPMDALGGERSFMVDDKQWAVYGFIAVAVGAGTINLRGLGSLRTLVLVNGRRVTASAGAGRSN